MRLRFVNCMLALAIAGCSAGTDEPAPVSAPHDDPHAADDVPSTTHTSRDPATQPCTIDNWQRLLPDLRQCDLAGAALGAANLRRVDLTDANLREAKADRAELFKAVLVRAKLAGAKLAGANLTSADLTNADLTDADLTGARLTNANVTGARFERAKTDGTTICMSGAAGPCW